jgi:hypothetical protein
MHTMAVMISGQGGFTKGERTSSLLYIYPLYMHGPFPAISGASGVKNWHPPRTEGRKGVRGREEDGWSGGLESFSS